MIVGGERVVLRPLRAEEVDRAWREMVEADPMTIAELPDEQAFRARLARSGELHGRSIDLAIESGGEHVGRIQTFEVPGRALPEGYYEVGIELHAEARGRGLGREALALLTGWLFEHAAARRVVAPTDPGNVAMRTVFERVGWRLLGQSVEFGRTWVVYGIARDEWRALTAP